jgi:hypothetical protein
VRITPRDNPSRTDLYSAVKRIYSDGALLHLVESPRAATRSSRGVVADMAVTLIDLRAVAEIALDEDGGL